MHAYILTCTPSPLSTRCLRPPCRYMSTGFWYRKMILRGKQDDACASMSKVMYEWRLHTCTSTCACRVCVPVLQAWAVQSGSGEVSLRREKSSRRRPPQVRPWSLCMCICMYVCMYMYICVCMLNKIIQKASSSGTSMITVHVCMRVRMCMRACVCLCKYASIFVCLCVCVYIYIYIYIYWYISTYIYIYIYIYIYTDDEIELRWQCTHMCIYAYAMCVLTQRIHALTMHIRTYVCMYAYIFAYLSR
jgi:hypothetical protein